MTKEFRLTWKMQRALQELLTLIKEESVPDPGRSDRSGNISEIERRILFVFDVYRKEMTDVRASRQGVDSKVYSNTHKEDWGSAREAAVSPPPQKDDAGSPRLGMGSHRFIPKEFPMEASPQRTGVGSPQAVAQSPAPPAKGTVVPNEPPPGFRSPQPAGIPASPPQPPSVMPLQAAGALPPSAAVPASDNKGGAAVMPIEPIKKSLFLKNAKAGEAYECPLDMDGLRSVRMEDAKGTGIVFDEATGRFRGIPVASGDFQFRLTGFLHGRPAEIIANLAVIPDPRSLWVSKDSDRTDPFWKPDQDFVLMSGDLLCVAASKRGRSHAKDGGFRDDDFGILEPIPGGWHVAAVADGAGSAKFSRRGSKVAIDAVLKDVPPLLEEHLDPDLDKLVAAHLAGRAEAEQEIRIRLYKSVAAASLQAAKAVEDEAGAHGEKAGAFSTTLVLCIAKRLPAGWFFAGFSVGDGGAAVFDVDDCSVTTLTAPDSGEFAGQTRFLHRSEFGTWEDVSRRIFFDVRTRFTALVLMTDGITDPKFPTEVSFGDPGKWRDFWTGDLGAAVRFSKDNPDLEKQFIDWLDFWSPGNHDDRTIAVLVP
ncbi:serine/threonine protein phosphatase PrpC [Azospirillum fermentarium]|uniref:PP2C family serine/threonine-protein phosphatase n=1 Tax=Azospirillum fermentarium TaxID=1233114 RepID=UPI002225B721|nr:protein phosphatase 2C domain-containing protein [Azospirillum fermentarium]MCW2244652.1 serine/threonine protein phosphatase PrpC [Azospirillum fermentarium]